MWRKLERKNQKNLRLKIEISVQYINSKYIHIYISKRIHTKYQKNERNRWALKNVSHDSK